MKQGMIKAFEPVTDDVVTDINRFTKRPLTAAEVYAFSMILCDNEVDRDFERFTFEALHELARLFVGRPGVFDHNHKSESQTARIYRAEVLFDEGKFTSTGEPYCYLLASAYIPRIEPTQDLIAKIDAGIVKEVSVGVGIGKMTCGICGQWDGACGHVKGELYDGALCHTLLEKPTDAYEFSFVVVPAQKNAGIVKRFSPKSVAQSEIMREILKIYIEGVLKID